MMKFLLVLALLFNVASAFTPPAMTFAVGKKTAAPKKAAKEAPKAAPKAVAKKAAPKAVAKKAAPKAVAKKVAPKAVAKKVAPKAVAKKVVKTVAPKAVAKKAAPKAVAKKVVKKVVKTAVKKPVAKKAVVVRKAPVKDVGTIPSAAIPGEEVPALLDGSFVGDVGFDPCFLSTKAEATAPYFNGLFGGKVNLSGLEWYREAELMHGRIAMVAFLGFLIPGFGTFPGNEFYGEDIFSYTNPLEALSKAPSQSIFQIFAFMAWMEFRRITIIANDGPRYQVGNFQNWGQGEGRWNPFGFKYTPEEYEEKQLQEIKHARLAMIGLLGLIFQANASGVGVVEQLSGAFVRPEYVEKAGYFFPEGI